MTCTVHAGIIFLEMPKVFSKGLSSYRHKLCVKCIFRNNAIFIKFLIHNLELLRNATITATTLVFKLYRNALCLRNQRDINTLNKTFKLQL